MVGPQTGPGAALAALARDLGFARIEPYASLALAEQQAAVTPLLFFFCAAVGNVRSLRPIAEAIRAAPSVRLRFAPLIYFARRPSVETIKACIGMGFDDVIALPYGERSLGERVLRHVGRPQVYYDTGSYFGPDRPHHGVAHGGAPYRRIEILRTPERGTQVLSDDLQVVV